MRLILVLLALIFAAGCNSNPNPYTTFYVDTSKGQLKPNQKILNNEIEPEIIIGSNSEVDTNRMMRSGFGLMGYSNFNSPDLNHRLLSQEHAQKIGADSVITSFSYTGSLSGSAPTVIPNISPSLASPNTGPQVIYTPFNVRRFDYNASFWRKHDNIGIGLYCYDLTDEMRKEISSNKGVYIVLVVNGSPAFDADLFEGDIIRKLNNIEIEDSGHFRSCLGGHKNQRITLEIYRNGKTFQKVVALN